MTIEEKVKTTVKDIFDEGYAFKDVFLEFCARMDEWLKERGLQAYIRIFKRKDTESLDGILDEINRIRDQFNITDYTNCYSRDYQANFAVMAMKRRTNYGQTKD